MFALEQTFFPELVVCFNIIHHVGQKLLHTKTSNNKQTASNACIHHGNWAGAVIRSLASHQCGPCSNPRLGVTCGLRLLVLFAAPSGLPQGITVFPSPKISTYQIESGSALSVLLLTTIFVITVVEMLWTHSAVPRESTALNHFRFVFYHDIQHQRKCLFQSVNTIMTQRKSKRCL